MTSLAERFAANLRALRDGADMTQEELSFRAGVHRTQISLMEGGERLPRFETVAKLVGALGVDHGALFAGITWEPHEFRPGGFAVEPGEGGGGATEET